jgi:hypothetical protein
MRRADYRRLIEAYGADPKRWPVEADRPVEALDDLHETLSAARRLDGLLAAADHSVDRDAEQRVMARLSLLPRQDRPTMAAFSWQRRLVRMLEEALWPKVAGLAMASLLGMAIGLTDLTNFTADDDSDDLVTLVLDETPMAGLER